MSNNYIGKHHNRGQGEAGWGDKFNGITAQLKSLRKPRPERRHTRSPLMEALLRSRGII
jgi:hypothetical protein